MIPYTLKHEQSIDPSGIIERDMRELDNEEIEDEPEAETNENK